MYSSSAHTYTVSVLVFTVCLQMLKQMTYQFSKCTEYIQQSISICVFYHVWCGDKGGEEMDRNVSREHHSSRQFGQTETKTTK